MNSDQPELNDLVLVRNHLTKWKFESVSEGKLYDYIKDLYDNIIVKKLGLLSLSFSLVIEKKLEIELHPLFEDKKYSFPIFTISNDTYELTDEDVKFIENNRKKNNPEFHIIKRPSANGTTPNGITLKNRYLIVKHDVFNCDDILDIGRIKNYVNIDIEREIFRKRIFDDKNGNGEQSPVDYYAVLIWESLLNIEQMDVSFYAYAQGSWQRKPFKFDVILPFLDTFWTYGLHDTLESEEDKVIKEILKTNWIRILERVRRYSGYIENIALSYTESDKKKDFITTLYSLENIANNEVFASSNGSHDIGNILDKLKNEIGIENIHDQFANNDIVESNTIRHLFRNNKNNGIRHALAQNINNFIIVKLEGFSSLQSFRDHVEAFTPFLDIFTYNQEKSIWPLLTDNEFIDSRTEYLAKKSFPEFKNKIDLTKKAKELSLLPFFAYVLAVLFNKSGNNSNIRAYPETNITINISRAADRTTIKVTYNYASVKSIDISGILNPREENNEANFESARLGGRLWFLNVIFPGIVGDGFCNIEKNGNNKVSFSFSIITKG